MEFKSSKFIVLKSFVLVTLGFCFLSLLVYAFSKNDVYTLIAVIAGLIISVLMSISEWKFVAKIENNNLYIYSGKKLKHEFDLEHASLYSKRVSGGNNIGTSCTLEVTVADQTTTVDFTPLGNNRYKKLLDELGFDENKAQVVETITKGE